LLTNRFEDILGGTTNLDESNGEDADIRNRETSITTSPTPTLRIHKDHPKNQIIGPVDTSIQTRNKSKEKISDALQDPSWVEAMQEELLQFKIQNVWTLVDCPKGVRPIGTKWVLKYKKDGRGIVIRNKARLVSQGHTQEEGIDYDEVFAPVARIEAIILFLAYASFMSFTLYQMDVKSAFLYGTIDEEVYKEDGIFLSQEKYVGDILKKFRYTDVRSSNTPMDKKNPWGKDETGKDVYLYLYRSMIGSLMYLTASRPDIMFAVCAYNQLLDYGYNFMNTNIYIDNNSAIYVRSSNTPMDKENPWRKDGTGKDVDLHLYRSMIGSLMYLNASRPDIMFAGHPKLGIWYPKASPFDLVAFSDSNYGRASQDLKSTRGSQFLGRRLISWQCKKQTIVATSTIEAEYVAAA
nr:hypothetical protein [Tanacetum cinerariifolium]